MSTQEHDLTVAPIPKLIKQISIPICIGFFFNTMFNVVDTYFGGQVSTTALAALSLTFPVFFLVIIFDQGISTGTTAVIANALGAKDFQSAQKYASQAISFSIIVSIIVTLGGHLLAPALLKLMGASGEYLRLALQYIDIIFWGSIFFLLISVFNSLLQARGDTKTLRNFLIVGFFLNVILDPWFLYGAFGVPKMGLTGVALATVVVQIIGTFYILFRAKKTGLLSRHTFAELMPEKKAFWEIIKQAGPASLNMMTIGIGLFVITYFISIFGQSAVAAYGIATRIEQIVLLPTIGLTIACLSIIGQNNGAKKYQRIRQTLSLCRKYGLIIMAIGGTLVFIFANLLMRFFTSDMAVVGIGTQYLHIAAFIFLAYAVLFITVSALQGLKKPMYAVWIGLYRQIVAPVMIFLLFVRVFGLGLYGVWWGIFAVTWSAAITTFLYGRYVMKKLPAD